MAITWSPLICAELPRTCKEAWQGGMLSSVVQGIRAAVREWMRTLSSREGVQAWDWKTVGEPCLSS